MQDIARIQRPAKLHPGTLLTDVIWGDPTLEDLNEGKWPTCNLLLSLLSITTLLAMCGTQHTAPQTKNDDNGAEFSPSDRGAGYFFAEEPCKRFLMDNGFVAMVRAHEVVAKGARVHFGCCWTVFSHPRYMGLRNVAATLVITNGAYT